MPPPVACWSCAGPVAADALFCATCRVVQPPRAIDHFVRLGMPRGFVVDVRELDRRYFALQRQLHPDRFATRSPRERAISQSQAVSLNEAYEVLKAPLARAEYLLRLAGLATADENTIRDPELLMEQMERRETLDSATRPAEVETCIGAAVADVMAAESDIASAFARGDAPAAAKGTLRLRYLQKLVDEARARHARLIAAD
ncbi:MAG: Fe-S protein assembly co-chaperone HscB [Alphaproteobacteria bacterium]|nr:Fe-S protein assembly co-chaperone HscB [Alphaproteobacteria bacterium]